MLDAMLPIPPTTAELRAARRIDLSRQPISTAAQAVTAAVVDLAVLHKATARPIAGKGLVTWRHDIGLMLGGLLKAGIVYAHRNKHGPMWKDGLPVRCDAFWTKADAMCAAGLLGIERGTRTAHAFMPGVFVGQPTKLWATQRLNDLALLNGVTDHTFHDDWRLSQKAQVTRPVITTDLVVLRPLSDKAAGSSRENVKSLPIPEAWQAEAAEIRAGLERLNEGLRGVEITGAVPPVFRRTFLHNLRLGGRFVTPGQGTFSNMRKQDRRRLTIAGKPAVEVDVSASQPTAFLAMTDPERLRGCEDLYELPGFPREAVKAFFVQSFGSGRPILRWGEGTDAGVRRVSVKALRTTILARFPTLAEITSILPTDLKASLPAERIHPVSTADLAQAAAAF